MMTKYKIVYTLFAFLLVQIANADPNPSTNPKDMSAQELWDEALIRVERDSQVQNEIRTRFASENIENVVLVSNYPDQLGASVSNPTIDIGLNISKHSPKNSEIFNEENNSLNALWALYCRSYSEGPLSGLEVYAKTYNHLYYPLNSFLPDTVERTKIAVRRSGWITCRRY